VTKKTVLDRRALLAPLAAAAAAGALIPLAARDAEANQPNMQAALNQLAAARASLVRAAHNKGGHRVKAIGLIDQAIAEVRLGIAAGA
jgi:hypothetical protein